ncbi:MAG: thiamine pyrophosphate-binding protein [Roseburia sp.]|nr:thiamine pyrophosphate-binding protein [Roseburia sp.]MCM1278442.1 thiamine pyrophosphate-binding protein [Robinsoniella sp.]
MIKVSDYIMDFLKEKGVREIFMLPGGGAMHLLDSMGSSGIDYICFQHEQGAAIAAEAYGQHTNEPGCLLVTSGPGATNAITGVTAGWIDSTPMFVLSGQSKRADLVGNKKVRQIGSQEVQIIDMVKPITKYAVQIMKPEEIRYHLEKAYYECNSGRPGPVWLSIPLDVQGAVIDETSLKGFIPEKAEEVDISPQVLSVVRLLKEAKAPLFIAGNGIYLAGATEILYQLLEKLKIPVLTTWKSIDMFDEKYPLYVGHPGIMGDRGANKILQEADLLISVGSRLDASITAFNDALFGKNAKKVIVDIDINEINRMEMPKEVGIASDALEFLSCLIENIKEESLPDWKDWLTYCKALRADYPTVTDKHKDTGAYVSAYYFIDELCRLLRADDVIAPESSGGAAEITCQAFKIKKGQKMKHAAGLGSMGFGLPYSIGSCIANDRRRTILINGDGAFQLNIQELETMHRLKLPIKMFVFNNGGYASIRNMQRGNFEGRYVASSEESGFTVPDISAVAKAYGFKTYAMANNEEMLQILPQILADDEPILCEVFTSPDETVWPRVKAMVLPDGSMQSGQLESMWPYMD